MNVAPAVAILNAKREDNTYPYEHLSGCGVGFKFMQAFALNNGIEFHHLIPVTGPLRRQYRIGHCPHYWRKPHSRLPRFEAVKQ